MALRKATFLIILTYSEKSDRDVCLHMVKKDQLRTIALMKRKQILKGSLKMVTMATSHSLLRFDFVALTQHFLPCHKETRFDFETSTSCKFLFRSMQ